MKRRIIFKRSDGGVTVRFWNNNEPANFQRAWDTLPPDAINPIVITTDDIPTDRTFRDAWEHGGAKIIINMSKAQAIQMERIRVARDAQLAELDKEAIIALGKGDTAALQTIEAQKQVLRDIPQTIDLTGAKTPEELKAIWPQELVKPLKIKK